MPSFPHDPDNHDPDALPELPVRAIADALEGGAPIDAVATLAGTTPIGLVCAGVQWLAAHRDEVTNAEHARICAVLAAALGPVTR